MQTSAPRKGIERKILTSILWVGILPLTLAFVVGLISAREAQSSGTKQTLLVAAQTTCAGLRMAADTRLNTVRKLSKDPAIIEALSAPPSQAPPLANQPAVRRGIADYLARESAGVSPDLAPSTFQVYDAEGQLLFGTSESVLWRKGQPLWPETIDSAQVYDLDFDPEKRRYVALAVAPVYGALAPGVLSAGADAASGQQPRLLGFVAELLDPSQMIKFALASDQARQDAGVERFYQFFYESAQRGMILSFLDERSRAYSSRLALRPLDERLSEHLMRPGTPSSGALELFGYRTGRGQEHVLLAYDKLFDYADLYIGVYQPASQVFAPLYRTAALALGVCGLGIAFLCFNAYRNVHNNIVRPVLLLNEGAQIIGQGDLELKLKIGTRDEIEELANSFNKMALALKANIGQLEESEERYRSLVTSMRDGIFQTDPDGVIGFMNPAGVAVFGFESREQVAGQKLTPLFLKESDYVQFTRQLKEKGFVERCRVLMKRRDDRSIYVELSGNLIHDDENNVIGIEGLFRDVTESVRLERAARERAERLSAISQIANVINSSLEAGRLYDSLVVEVKKLVNFDHAEIALLNDAKDAFQVRQLWPAQAPVPGLRSIEDDSHCSAWVARRRQSLFIDDITTGNWPFQPDDFPEGTKSCLCVPLYATGRIIGSLNLSAKRYAAFSPHDVEVLEQMAPHVAVAIRNAQLLENLQASLEEVTRAREKLHEANEELKTLDEMKTNLLSNVSHELRTPLVAIMGYTDMIYNEKVGPINEDQRDYLGISLRNIEKLVTLIENLLDFSRLHRGTETLVFDSFDIVECARASTQIVRPVADSRGIELKINAPKEAVVVEGDKGKIGQVFNNLLSNAVKFNKSNGEVAIEIVPRQESVDISVSDTGIGIPPEALDKVFTRFYQYDSSSTRKYGGTGIGLAIAQDIARLHGSRLTVSSKEGEGSTFRFSLPLPYAKAKRDKEAAAAKTPETHLLLELVTRDRGLINQVRNLLLAEGMDVIHAAHPFHAVALGHKHHPDCLLLDLDTVEDHDELLEEMAAGAPLNGLPLVVLSGDEQAYSELAGRASSRLQRGFRKSTLLSAIRNAMHGPREEARSLGNRILCVDDDPEVLIFMVRLLENEGYPADSCESGEEALQMAASREYGIVLLDIAMPGMDGWETCRNLKNDPELAGIKVFMVTAKPVQDDNARLRENGADGMLSKPFRGEDLVELVRSHAGSKVVQKS